MPLLVRSLAVVLMLALGPVAAAGEEPAVPDDHAARMKAGMELFSESVRDVLIRECIDCHGGKSKKADLDLSTRETLIDSGHVHPGRASESWLYQVIRHDEEPHMPQGGDKLPDDTIAAIAKWIDLGAPYDKPLIEDHEKTAAPAGAVTDADREFWSFRPLRVTAPPQPQAARLLGSSRAAGWPRTPVDQFILAKQEELGLRPNPIADRRTLIRRAYFDLIGLPPAPEEVDAFVNDPDPDAYDKLIDRLLDSPHYGERWARHWMDVARFAESHGYEQDYDRPHAYHYRDFLIRALNDDMPYDQFVRWQLAGDELAPDDPLSLMATGFLGGGAFPTQLTEAEFESARYDELDDMIATTGSAFLGLSIGCARCHDHKFDPIPARDYYRLIASFATTIRSEIDLAVRPGAEPAKVQVTSEGFPHMKHHADERGFPHFYPEVYILSRGDVHQKQGVAEQSFLHVLMRNGHSERHWHVEPPDGWTRTSFRRAALANWITDPVDGAGHLAARVIVNRLWQHHFGRGIVATPNDFGTQGERPSHPELLDWLATDLIHHGWRLKRLHKLIMTSAVYMQTCDHDEARARIDRENVFFWRRVPRRLEAEAIRDAMLAVSGMLDDSMYGPGTLDQNSCRRSVYFFIKRSQLIPMMMLFDWPEHLVSIGQRAVTTTAPQALLFMNSPQARRYAQGMADRVTGMPADEAIRHGYRLAFGRGPNEQERRSAVEFLSEQAGRHREAGKQHSEQLALVDLCQMLMSSNEFVYVE